MNCMRHLCAWIWSWFSRKPRVYRTKTVEELPERLDDSTLYLVGEGEHLWVAAMVCPCGCEQVIQLNLIQPRRPLWRIVRHSDGTVTLHPSVWRTVGCQSHFWFRSGRVEWCLEFALNATNKASIERPSFDSSR